MLWLRVPSARPWVRPWATWLTSWAALAPAGRVAAPEEIGDVIAFLASDDASFVHGVTVAVGGAFPVRWGT